MTFLTSVSWSILFCSSALLHFPVGQKNNSSVNQSSPVMWRLGHTHTHARACRLLFWTTAAGCLQG